MRERKGERERRREGGRERGKEKGRAERNASSMQETDIFNIEDDFFILILAFRYQRGRDSL